MMVCMWGMGFCLGYGGGRWGGKAVVRSEVRVRRVGGGREGGK